MVVGKFLSQKAAFAALLAFASLGSSVAVAQAEPDEDAADDDSADDESAEEAPDPDGEETEGDAPEAGANDEAAPDKADKPAAKDDGETDGEATEEEPEKIIAVGSSRHIDVKAKSLRLTESARDRLLSVAKRYYAVTRRPLVITGGDRSAHRQAELMFKKLQNGEDLLKIYARDDLVRQMLVPYEQGKQEGRSAKRITQAMGEVIEGQMVQKQYISRHLSFTAADVRSRDMKPEHVTALMDAVKAEPGVNLVDERGSISPHLHLGF